MNTTAGAAFKEFAKAVDVAAARQQEAMGRAIRRATTERKAIEAVAEYLAEREDSPAFRGRGSMNLRSQYRARAAALLAGEDWARPE